MDEGKRKPTGDYEVGYAKPPQETRFKRRAKRSNLERLDVSAILSAPVTMRAADGSVKKVSPFEAALRGDVKRALQDGNIAAAARVIEIFEIYGVLTTPPTPLGRGLIIAKFANIEQSEEFREKLGHYGYPPPWPGEDPDKWVGIVEHPDPRRKQKTKRKKDIEA